MGHGQAFTAVYAKGGIFGTSTATKSDATDRQIKMVPVATTMEIMFDLGLRARSECRSWRQ
eukprot:6182278-Pleurochrysis_carterae.AAC.1